MSVERTVVYNTADFDAALNTAKQSGKQVVLLLTGSKDPETKISWCPDCTEAEPFIEGALKAAEESDKGIFFIQCEIVRSEYKENPDYFYRKHPLVALKRIPTLIKLGASSKVAELVETECHDEDLVSELILE